MDTVVSNFRHWVDMATHHLMGGGLVALSMLLFFTFMAKAGWIRAAARATIANRFLWMSVGLIFLLVLVCTWGGWYFDISFTLPEGPDIPWNDVFLWSWYGFLFGTPVLGIIARLRDRYESRKTLVVAIVLFFVGMWPLWHLF